MVDLDEAGERLRGLTLEEPTPIVELRCRRTARTRRRRQTVGAAGAALVVVAALVAAVAVGSPGSPGPQRVTTGPGPTGVEHPRSAPPIAVPVTPGGPYSASPSVAVLPPTNAVPAAGGPQVPAGRSLSPPHAAGATPVDYGLLRLWLPPGWHVWSGAGTVAGSCPPAKSVLFGSDPDGACPSSPATLPSYVVVEPVVENASPSGQQTDRINGFTVHSAAPGGAPSTTETTMYTVPALGVQILASAAGHVVVDSLGPSSLYDVIHLQSPVAPPASWKTVNYGGFEARVPRNWPVHTLRAPSENPGDNCSGYAEFTEPEVDLGTGGGPGSNCPEISIPGDPPEVSNGLWMQPYSANVPGGGDFNTQLAYRPLSEVLARADPDNYFAATASVAITSGARRITVVVGLGTDPGVAEEILSSFRLARA
jgi:hypothetical protein